MEQVKQSEKTGQKNFNSMLRSIIMTSLAVVTIFIPMVLLFTIGEATHDLDGEKDYSRPSFSIGEFFDRSFQSNFENWFSTKYPLRQEIVELYGEFDARKDSIDINFLKSSSNNTAANAAAQDTTYEIPAETEEVVEEVIIEPKFPEYVLADEELSDPSGYRGTDHVVIGKNGCLYENGYINEYYGFTHAKKYIRVTGEELKHRVDVLKSIQDELEARGVAFCVVITPSKASAMPDYVPDWYMAKYTAEPGYVRPYERFAEFLRDTGVYHVDSSRLYASLGLTNTFPKTGIHWNKFAAYETCVAIIEEYERQTGTEIKHLAADEVRFSKDPPGFGNPEKDIFGIVYSGRRNERENAIVDDRYYWLDVYTSDNDNPGIPHMLVQGGSFTGDFDHYFQAFNIADAYKKYYYNNNGKVDINWEREIGRTSFVLLEVNEQFVYNMGGNAPSWGQNDLEILPLGNNIVDSLYDYLTETPE